MSQGTKALRSVWTAARPWLDRLYDALPLLYLVWATPVLLTVAIVTPPWQNPDEASHMLRVSQIAHGGLLGYRFGETAGGMADPAILRSLQAVYDVLQHPEHKISASMLASIEAPAPADLVQVGFPNTAQYAPFLYAPAVLAMEAARLLKLDVVQTLWAARITAALAGLLIAYLALCLARRTRLVIGTLLALPMTMALFASPGNDGVMIALTLAVVACMDRILTEDREPGFRELLFMATSLLLLIVARPVNLPLAALPLVCVQHHHRRIWLVVGTITGIGILWTTYVLAEVTVPLRPIFDAGAQLRYIVAHPLAIVTIASNTISNVYIVYVTTFVGVLGALDTVLPRCYYEIAFLVLGLSLVGATAGPTRRSVLALSLSLMTAGAIFFTLYLTWTPPGADHVDGVQGRYFLGLAAVLALAVPRWRRAGVVVQPVATTALLGFAAVTPMIMIHAIVTRYYLTP